jgi:magnesium transporter
MAYGPDRFIEKRIDNLAELDAFASSPVVWVNVDGVGDTGFLRNMQQRYGLHSLALEDVVNLVQRPKVDQYDEHMFVVVRLPASEPGGESEQVSIFLGAGHLLTFQEKTGDCFDAVRERLRSGRGRIRSRGPDYLCYALIDAAVDAHFPVLERVGGELEQIEEVVFSTTNPNIPSRIQHLRGELREVRRANLPMRDVLQALLRPDAPYVTEETKVYLRDCWDHCLRVAEIVDHYREESADLMNAHVSGISIRTNEVMKVLTIMAAIFIPLSFIAGLFGMNFDPEVSPWNMPELRWRWGYPMALGLMLAVALGLLAFFRRKGWFGQGRDGQPPPAVSRRPDAPARIAAGEIEAGGPPGNSRGPDRR